MRDRGIIEIDRELDEVDLLEGLEDGLTEAFGQDIPDKKWCWTSDEEEEVVTPDGLLTLEQANSYEKA